MTFSGVFLPTSVRLLLSSVLIDDFHATFTFVRAVLKGRACEPMGVRWSTSHCDSMPKCMSFFGEAVLTMELLDNNATPCASLHECRTHKMMIECRIIADLSVEPTR
jgi:hypothetical protein